MSDHTAHLRIIIKIVPSTVVRLLVMAVVPSGALLVVVLRRRVVLLLRRWVVLLLRWWHVRRLVVVRHGRTMRVRVLVAFLLHTARYAAFMITLSTERVTHIRT